MKKTILNLIIFWFLSITSQAQWGPDVRLTNNPFNSSTSGNNQRKITVSGNYVHVVWEDVRNGNSEIYYKRSSDFGFSWSPDIRLTNDNASSSYPSVAVFDSYVHIVWQDTRDGNSEIYYKRSTNAGYDWEADMRLTNNPQNSVSASVAVIGALLHLVWHNQMGGGANRVFYKRSTDNGLSWGADHLLVLSNSQTPSITVFNSDVHLVWNDYRGSNNEIYYKLSTDGGISWGPDTRLTFDPALSWTPCVAASNSYVHVVWPDRRDGNLQIYYKRSRDGGMSWEADRRLTLDTAASGSPSVAANGSFLHIVWQDQRDGNREIYYKRSSDNGLTWSEDIRLTNDTARSWHGFVAARDDVVHVVWTDNRDLNDEIYYKRNPAGNPSGLQIRDNHIPVVYKLYQNYPNPFNPETTIEFDIPIPSFVKLSIFDLTGRELEVLLNRDLPPGRYQVKWNANNFSSGLYLYRLLTDKYTSTNKMILIK